MDRRLEGPHRCKDIPVKRMKQPKNGRPNWGKYDQISTFKQGQANQPGPVKTATKCIFLPFTQLITRLCGSTCGLRTKPREHANGGIRAAASGVGGAGLCHDA